MAFPHSTGIGICTELRFGNFPYRVSTEFYALIGHLRFMSSRVFLRSIQINCAEAERLVLSGSNLWASRKEWQQLVRLLPEAIRSLVINDRTVL